MPKEIVLNAFDMNCVGHIQQGMWTHPRDQSSALYRSSVLDRLRPHAGGGPVRRHLFRRCGRRLRRLRRQPRRGPARRRAGAGQRPDAADSGDGRGDAASVVRRHVESDGRAAVSVRAAHVDARSSDARPGRLEHRHRLSGQRVARDRPDRPDGARRPLRPRRRIHGAGLQTVGMQLGRRRGAARQSDAASMRTRRKST